MIPTKEEINRLAAEACGYKVVGWNDVLEVPLRYGEYLLVNPAGRIVSHHGRSTEAWAWSDAPKFCSDRNALPELWKVVKAQEKTVECMTALQELIERPGHLSAVWPYVTASPLLQTIAALKALSVWPDEWEIPEEESE